MEDSILLETKNFYLNKKMEICLNGTTHAVIVGKADSLEHAKSFMDKAEKYPDNVRKMYNHW